MDANLLVNRGIMDFSTVIIPQFANRGIMTVLKSIIPRFTNKPWDYGFQYCHNPTAGNFQNIQVNTNKKGTKFAETV